MTTRPHDPASFAAGEAAERVTREESPEGKALQALVNAAMDPAIPQSIADSYLVNGCEDCHGPSVQWSGRRVCLEQCRSAERECVVRWFRRRAINPLEVARAIRNALADAIERGDHETWCREQEREADDQREPEARGRVRE